MPRWLCDDRVGVSWTNWPFLWVAVPWHELPAVLRRQKIVLPQTGSRGGRRGAVGRNVIGGFVGTLYEYRFADVYPGTHAGADSAPHETRQHGPCSRSYDHRRSYRRSSITDACWQLLRAMVHWALNRIEIYGVKSYIHFRPVLGCIDASDTESRLILQHFSGSIKSTFLCTCPIRKSQISLKFY